jgi:hypothetical protein
LDIPDEIGQQLTRVKAHGAAAAQEWSGGDGFNPRRAKREQILHKRRWIAWILDGSIFL